MPHDPRAYPYEAIRGPGHTGYSSHSAGSNMSPIDFRCPEGTRIYAPAGRRWRVTRSRNLGDESYGQWIEIVSGGVILRFAHLSRRRVAEGAVIEGGRLLGETGNTGDSSGPHLHFEANRAPYEWAKRIWTGQAQKEWDEMATKQEIKEAVAEVVQEIVEAEVRKWGEVFAEWAMAATTKTILGRQAPTGYGGDLSETYKKVIAESFVAAAKREKTQHPA